MGTSARSGFVTAAPFRSLRQQQRQRQRGRNCCGLSAQNSAWVGSLPQGKRGPAVGGQKCTLSSRPSRNRRRARWTCFDVGFLGGLEEALELLIATVAVVPIFKRLNLSPVLGFLVAGVALGPHGFKLIPNVEAISEIADIGVLFLLFEMGLELSLDRLKKLRVYAFGLGTLQMMITSTVLAAGAKFMGAGISESLVIGTGLSLSSSAFVLQLLAERKEKSTRYATATFGVLLLQDVAVVPLLVLVPLLATTEWSGMQEVETLISALALTALKALGAITGVVFIGGALLRPLFRFVSESRSPEAFTSVVLATVLGAGLITDALGLSMTLGAFIAGVLLSESSFRAKIVVDIEPFRGLLLGLFFITTGMSMDLSLFLTQPLEIIALIVSLIGVKASILGLLSLPFGLSAAEGTKIGLLLGQGGEFGFVLFALANKLGFLPEEVNQILVVVIVLTMALTPAMTEVASRLAPVIESRLHPTGVDDIEEVVPNFKYNLTNAVVIVGFGEVGAVVADMLARKFLTFIAVDNNPQKVEEANVQGIPCLLADAQQPGFLADLGIEKPAAVVLTMNSSKVAVGAIAAVRSTFPDAPIYVRAHDLGRMRLLTNLGVVATFPESFETSLALGEEVLRGYNIPEQDVVAIGRTLRNERGFAEIRKSNDSNRRDTLARRSDSKVVRSDEDDKSGEVNGDNKVYALTGGSQVSEPRHVTELRNVNGRSDAEDGRDSSQARHVTEDAVSEIADDKDAIISQKARTGSLDDER
mmetsp:Transcript_2096/g.6264  ORF Transcript_2096/g.6264 Transcript_2096/m.6264 type:complete len:758 (+) Transcript_2096:181-2454(+)